MMIWFFGKVYDDGISVADIEKDIEARLKEYTNVEIGGYEVALHRSLNVDPKEGCILEVDTFLISGVGYSRDMPEYRNIGDPEHQSLFTHYFNLAEFEKLA